MTTKRSRRGTGGPEQETAAGSSSTDTPPDDHTSSSPSSSSPATVYIQDQMVKLASIRRLKGENHPEVAEVLNVLALFHHHVLSNREASLQLHTQALRIFRHSHQDSENNKLSSPSSSSVAQTPVVQIAVTLTDIGHIHRSMGNWEKALSSYAEASKLFEEIGTSDMHPSVCAASRGAKSIMRDFPVHGSHSKRSAARTAMFAAAAEDIEASKSSVLSSEEAEAASELDALLVSLCPEEETKRSISPPPPPQPCGDNHTYGRRALQGNANGIGMVSPNGGLASPNTVSPRAHKSADALLMSNLHAAESMCTANNDKRPPPFTAPKKRKGLDGALIPMIQSRSFPTTNIGNHHQYRGAQMHTTLEDASANWFTDSFLLGGSKVNASWDEPLLPSDEVTAALYSRNGKVFSCPDASLLKMAAQPDHNYEQRTANNDNAPGHSSFSELLRRPVPVSKVGGGTATNDANPNDARGLWDEQEMELPMWLRHLPPSTA